MAKTNLRPQPQQLDLFQLLTEYPEQIIDNSNQSIDFNDLDLTQNVLVCNAIDYTPTDIMGYHIYQTVNSINGSVYYTVEQTTYCVRFKTF